MPEEYSSLKKLQQLPSIELTNSTSKGQPIIAYYDSKDGKIYVYSEDLIVFNKISSALFVSFSKLESIKFGKIDTSNVTDMNKMFFQMCH